MTSTRTAGPVGPTGSSTLAGPAASAGSRAPRPGVPGAAYALLGRARSVLAEADAADSPADRFGLAHLGALRVAAALLADRGRPAASRRRLVSAWSLIDTIAPEFGEWAVYFAAAASSRAAIEAGAIGVVDAREADDQLRAAQEFLALVESSFGLLAAALAS